MNRTRAGRPNDKELYIEALMSHVKNGYPNDVELKSSLLKLNSSDLLLFNAYICKTLGQPLKELLHNIPKETAAQSQRYNDIVDVSNGME